MGEGVVVRATACVKALWQEVAGYIKEQKVAGVAGLVVQWRRWRWGGDRPGPETPSPGRQLFAPHTLRVSVQLQPKTGSSNNRKREGAFSLFTKVKAESRQRWILICLMRPENRLNNHGKKET